MIVDVCSPEGNIFVVMANASNEMNDRAQAIEMYNRVIRSHSYEEALSIVGEYVDLEVVNHE